MVNRKKGPALKLQDINGVWDFLAWALNFSIFHLWKILILLAIAGIVFSGFNMSYKDFSFSKTPAKFESNTEIEMP